MDREKVFQAALKSGIADADLSSEDQLVSDYGCCTDAAMRFYAIAYEAGLQKGQQLAGEFICRKCGLRQDGDKAEPNF